MKKQRHIYFFLPNFSIGGAGNSIFNICKEIKNSSYSIEIISLGKNYYKNAFNKIGIKTIELTNKKTIIAIFRILFLIKKKSKRKEIVFVSNINYANVLSSIFLKNLRNLKLILIERTPFQELEIFFNFKDFFKKRIIFYLAKIFYGRADYIVGNSHAVSSYIESKIKQKVLTKYPIIKINNNIKKKYNKILNISWIGRNTKEKNLDDFIKCINLIKKQNIVINIITNSKSKKEIKNLISQNLLKKVNFYNFTNNNKTLNKIYKMTDIYINTSIYEGFPNTVAEAVNHGCLVISSKSFGGCREIIKNERYGFLYSTYNYKQLFKKMNYSIENFHLCKNKIVTAKKNLQIKAINNNSNYKNFFKSI
jgi:glycosyltransferase involved in cell wall biosynthesis